MPHGEEKVFTDEELNTLIDPILSADDLNHDGYMKNSFSYKFLSISCVSCFSHSLRFIDYPEFIRAQQKAAASNQQNNQNR